MKAQTQSYDSLKKLDDDQWHEVLVRSINEPVVDGVEMPRFPSDRIQVLFTSHKQEAALGEAFKFFRVTKAAAKRHGHPISRDTRLLDFGIGWGRIARFFLRDIAPQNILGVDVNPEILRDCEALLPGIKYLECQQGAPLKLKDNSIDLVTGFSVFSHLSPSAAEHWINELHRVLKPGGTAVMTTLGPTFSSVAYQAALDPEKTSWHKEIGTLTRQAYPDWQTRLVNWPKDEFLYLPTGGGFTYTASAYYGLAMIPEAWARKNWSDRFDITDFLFEPGMMDQSIMVLRRK